MGFAGDIQHHRPGEYHFLSAGERLLQYHLYVTEPVNAETGQFQDRSQMVIAD